MERAKQKITAPVPGEHPAGPVPTMGGGGEADDQELRRGVAKSRQRLPPVRLFAVAPNLFPCHLLPVRHQSWTASAVNDRFLQLFQVIQHARRRHSALTRLITIRAPRSSSASEQDSSRSASTLGPSTLRERMPPFHTCAISRRLSRILARNSAGGLGSAIMVP